MAKLKQYGLTHYHRGIEVNVMCVTTSKKKFAELMDMTVGHISNYATSFEPRDSLCIENPDILYAKCGMGGEGCYFLPRNEVKLLSDFKVLIDEHRKIYSTYRDYDEAKRNGEG